VRQPLFSVWTGSLLIRWSCRKDKPKHKRRENMKKNGK
jgi:hypothetical protein